MREWKWDVSRMSMATVVFSDEPYFNDSDRMLPDDRTSQRKEDEALVATSDVSEGACSGSRALGMQDAAL